MSGAAASVLVGRSQAADGTVLLNSTTPGSSSYTFGSDAPNFAWLEGWGGGGAGNSSGGKSPIFYGGAGAGYFKHHMAVYPGLTINFNVASAGVSAGGNGGSTTVTSPSLTASGGGGASTSAASSSPGSGTGGNLSNLTGSNGGAPNTYSGGAGANGGATQNTLFSDGNVPGGGGAGIGANGAVGEFKITAKST